VGAGVGARIRRHELPKDVGAWLHIAADGHVTVFTGKVEVGQNIRTSLAQLVAEELRVPFDAITMTMGDTDLTPWDMGTFGSRTTPTMGPQLRTMAAAARQMLVEMAAQRWHVDAQGLTAADGRVTDPQSKRSLTYGELTRGEKLVKTVSRRTGPHACAEWKIAGTPVPKAEGTRLRDRQTQVSLRHNEAGDDVWRCASARWVQRDSGVARHKRGGEAAWSEGSARRRFHWVGRPRCFRCAESRRGNPVQMECAGATFEPWASSHI
jgi:CO/xanthine dehydrogenase Mo-binding subunit